MMNKATRRVKFLKAWGCPSSSQIFGPGNIVRVTDYWFGVLTRGGIAESAEFTLPPLQRQRTEHEEAEHKKVIIPLDRSG